VATCPEISQSSKLFAGFGGRRRPCVPVKFLVAASTRENERQATPPLLSANTRDVTAPSVASAREGVFISTHLRSAGFGRMAPGKQVPA